MTAKRLSQAERPAYFVPCVDRTGVVHAVEPDRMTTLCLKRAGDMPTAFGQVVTCPRCMTERGKP